MLRLILDLFSCSYKRHKFGKQVRGPFHVTCVYSRNADPTPQSTSPEKKSEFQDKDHAHMCGIVALYSRRDLVSATTLERASNSL